MRRTAGRAAGLAALAFVLVPLATPSHAGCLEDFSGPPDEMAPRTVYFDEGRIVIDPNGPTALYARVATRTVAFVNCVV